MLCSRERALVYGSSITLALASSLARQYVREPFYDNVCHKVTREFSAAIFAKMKNGQLSNNRPAKMDHFKWSRNEILMLNNNFLNKHLPRYNWRLGYNCCGPGTKLAIRIARGDTGINQFDDFCKQHDIIYSLNPL